METESGGVLFWCIWNKKPCISEGWMFWRPAWGPVLFTVCFCVIIKENLRLSHLEREEFYLACGLSRLYRHGTDLCLASSEAPWQKAEPKQVHHMAREGARDSGGIPDF